MRLHRLEGGNTTALLKLIAELRSGASAKPGSAVDVACCFEAGRDGVWLHRLLKAHGIAAYVLEPTSILVNRRARRAKTDRLDAEGMLRVLATWLGGDRQVCSMVRVPTPDEEDAKRPHREREHLVQDKLRIENRIEALLLPRASGEGRHSALGSATWRGFERVTDVFCRHCCGPRSIAYAADLFWSWN